MSWARVDDGLWEHQKFEEMRLAGEYQAIALWILAVSYCGQKLNPRITPQEAAMLLCCGLADAESAMNVLASRGLLDTDPATKQTSSRLLHDWDCYRSKNEAKVRAGRKGGERKAEKAKGQVVANAKQEPSRAVADAKQTSSPVSVSDSVTDSVTDSDSYSATAVAVNEIGRQIDHVWDHWLLMVPTTRRKTLASDSVEYRLIKKRLAQYSADSLCLAIDGMFRDTWSVNNNCSLGWALRQDDKNQNIDKFIALALNNRPVMSPKTQASVTAGQRWLERQETACSK